MATCCQLYRHAFSAANADRGFSSRMLRLFHLKQCFDLSDDAGSWHMPQTDIHVELFARSNGGVTQHLVPDRLGNRLKVELSFLSGLCEYLAPQCFGFLWIACAKVLTTFPP